MQAVEETLLYWFRRVKNRISKWKKNLMTIKPSWLATAGDHWFRFGMIPTTRQDYSGWRFSRPVAAMVMISLIIRHCLMLLYDTFSNNSLRFRFGDHFAFMFSSRPAWLFVNISHISIALYVFLYYLIFASNSKLEWLELFKELQSGDMQVLSLIGDRKLRKNYFSICAVVFKHYLPSLELFMVFYTVAAVFTGLLNVSNFWEAFLALVGFLHYLVFIMIIGMVCCVQATYFSLLCLYAAFSVASVTKAVKEISRKAKNSKKPLILYQKLLEKQFVSFQQTVKITRSCNDFFGENLKYFVTSIVVFLLVSIYGLSHSETASEYLAFLIAIEFDLFLISSPFLMSSVVSKQLTGFYKTCNAMQQRNWRIRFKLDLLMVIELFASKKQRVGFRLKNWCVLNKVNGMKVSSCKSNH